MSRKYSLIWTFLIALGISGAASAQTAFPTASGKPAPGSVMMGLDGSGNAVPASATAPIPVTPATGAFTTAGCTVGTASALCLAAATAVHSVTAQNTSAAATVACAWGGAAALNSSGSFVLVPGQAVTFGPQTAGVPSGALNCISTAASTPLFVIWN